MGKRLLAGLLDGGGDLAKHDNTVTVEEGNTGETLARLEGIADEGLDGSELNLGHFVGLEGMGVFHLLATGLLAHLPVKVDDTAGGAAATDETDGGVTLLDLTGDIEDLDLGGEGLDGGEGAILLVDHDVTGTGHVHLVETLNVQTDVVTGLGRVDLLVMHFDGEHLAAASVGGGVGGHEDNISVLLDETLLDATGEDITDTLNLVDTGDGHAHVLVGVTLRGAGHVVEGIEELVDVQLLAAGGGDVNAVPPLHVLGLLEEVVTHPAGDGDDGDGVGDEVLLPADLHKHVLHLIADLVVALLGVLGDIAIHLVDANDELLDTQQVDKTGVLASLALDLTGLVVATLDGGDEVTIGGNHQAGNIGLGGTGNHVLDEIAMAGGIDDGVVPLLGEELLGGAGDGHTTLTLLLLTVHVESEGERRLTETVGLSLELLHFTLGDTAELEEQTTGGRGLAGVDLVLDKQMQQLEIKRIPVDDFVSKNDENTFLLKFNVE